METSRLNNAGRYAVDEILDRMEVLQWKKILWRGNTSDGQKKDSGKQSGMRHNKNN